MKFGRVHKLQLLFMFFMLVLGFQNCNLPGFQPLTTSATQISQNGGPNPLGEDGDVDAINGDGPAVTPPYQPPVDPDSQAGEPPDESPAVDVVAVVGSCKNGSRVSIRGSGFGADQRPMLWDSVENQPLYSNLVEGQIVPEGVWDTVSCPNYTGSHPVLLSSLNPRTPGSKYYTGKIRQEICFPSAVRESSRPRQQLYVQWRFRISHDPDTACPRNSSKFIRVWDQGSVTSPTWISWTQMHMTYGEKNAGKVHWGSFRGKVGSEWNLMEIYADKATGFIRASHNGAVVHEVRDFDPYANNAPLVVRVLGFEPNQPETCDSNLKIDIDDIYVSERGTRFEVTSEPFWKETDTRQVQSPRVWQSDLVEFDLNLGEVRGEALYVHLVDGSGKSVFASKIACQ